MRRKRRKQYLAIDPGVKGGVAVLDGTVMSAYKCPPTVKEMADLLYEKTSRDTIAIIEAVHSFPGQGVASTFKFGNNFGQWQGILSAMAIPYIQVSPQKWMKMYQPLPKIKGDRKRRLKEIALEYHPEIKVTLDTADAIVMAYYLKETDK
tara:strand:+ start:117 stop:566 length:450 start_codon:yes stop_codon:yes gene_type:complete